MTSTNFNPQILIIGCNGQLGWELQRTLPVLGTVNAVDYPDLNLADPGQVRLLLRQLSPHIIVNAAAYTNVDQAESEPEIAMAVNGQAPGVLAEEALRQRAILVHYSTDYVFDGKKEIPYTESDAPNPLNVYGHTKLAGERAVQAIDGASLIFRTSWVYSLRGSSFATKVLQWSRSKKTIHVVTDQVGSPTWSRMLAEATAQVLAQALRQGDIYSYIQQYRGLYHLAGDGRASRFEFALAVLKHDPHKEQQIVEDILPALTSDFPSPASRPKFCPLDCSMFNNAFRLRLPAWEEALKLAMS